MSQKPLLSKEPKSRLRKHLELLTLFLLLSVSMFMLAAILNYRSFIYPIAHVSQPSPKKFIGEQTVVYEHGSRDKKQVALTFDADMTWSMYQLLRIGIVKSWYNRPIKETLDREKAKATIFFSGLWTKAYPKEAYELAHDSLIEIGNHSYSHPGFTSGCYSLQTIGSNQLVNEVESAQTMIFATTGIVPKYFRFPGGCYDNTAAEAINKLGLKIVHWDVVAGDGFNNNVDSIVYKVENSTQNGSIIVFHIHDGTLAPKTNDALIKIIPDLRKKGFEFVTLTEILNE